MLINKLRKNKQQATAIEYAIIASMLSVVIIVGLEATGLALTGNYESSSAKLENSFEASAGEVAAIGGVSPHLLNNPDAINN